MLLAVSAALLALAAATTTQQPAALLPGDIVLRVADLFIVRGNPLEDIRHTRNVRWVMKSGTLHSAAELLESVKGKMGPASMADDLRWRPQAR